MISRTRIGEKVRYTHQSAIYRRSESAQREQRFALEGCLLSLSSSYVAGSSCAFQIGGQGTNHDSSNRTGIENIVLYNDVWMLISGF